MASTYIKKILEAAEPANEAIYGNFPGAGIDAVVSGESGTSIRMESLNIVCDTGNQPTTLTVYDGSEPRFVKEVLKNTLADIEIPGNWALTPGNPLQVERSDVSNFCHITALFRRT